MDFVWQFGSAKGVILLIHGCKHTQNDWWPKSEPFCPSCYGMPMEMSIVRSFVKAGYTVLAIKPTHNANKTQCWHPNDKEYVSRALKYVYNALNTSIASVPLYALGIANGGVFLGNHITSIFETYDLKVSAMVLMHSGIWHNNMKSHSFAPTLFIDMNRNGDLCLYNNITMEKMIENGIEVMQLTADPYPIDPLYFFTRLPYLISREDSIRIHEQLGNKGFIWPMSFILLKDPNTDRFYQEYKELFESVVPKIVPAIDSFNGMNSPLLQLLRVAWGYKETTDEFNNQMIQWFEHHDPNRKHHIIIEE